MMCGEYHDIKATNVTGMLRRGYRWETGGRSAANYLVGAGS